MNSMHAFMGRLTDTKTLAAQPPSIEKSALRDTTQHAAVLAANTFGIEPSANLRQIPARVLVAVNSSLERSCQSIKNNYQQYQQQQKQRRKAINQLQNAVTEFRTTLDEHAETFGISYSERYQTMQDELKHLEKDVTNLTKQVVLTEKNLASFFKNTKKLQYMLKELQPDTPGKASPPLPGMDELKEHVAALRQSMPRTTEAAIEKMIAKKLKNMAPNEAFRFSRGDYPLLAKGMTVIKGQTSEGDSVLRSAHKLGSGAVKVAKKATDSNHSGGPMPVVAKYKPQKIKAAQFEQQKALAEDLKDATHVLTQKIHCVTSASGHENYICVMEECKGDLAAESVKAEPPARRLDLFKQAMQGVVEMHAKNIVHRDLKPDNIFLTLQGEAKIADFDMAYHIQADAAGKYELTYSGTRGYIDDKAAYKMKTANINDVKALDIYSMGVVLGDLITTNRESNLEYDDFQALPSATQEAIKNLREDMMGPLVNEKDMRRPNGEEVLARLAAIAVML